MSCSECGYAICTGCTYRDGGGLTCAACCFGEAPAKTVASPALTAHPSGNAAAADIPIGNGAAEEDEVAEEATPTPPPAKRRGGLVESQHDEDTPESTPLVPPPSPPYRPGDVLYHIQSPQLSHAYGFVQVRRTYEDGSKMLIAYNVGDPFRMWDDALPGCKTEVVETAALRWPADVHAASYHDLHIDAFGPVVPFGMPKSAMVWYSATQDDDELRPKIGFGMKVQISEDALAMSNKMKNHMNMATQLWTIKQIFSLCR